MHFLHLIAVSCVGALTPLATPRNIRATRVQAAAVEAKAVDAAAATPASLQQLQSNLNN